MKGKKKKSNKLRFKYKHIKDECMDMYVVNYYKKKKTDLETMYVSSS